MDGALKAVAGVASAAAALYFGLHLWSAGKREDDASSLRFGRITDGAAAPATGEAFTPLVTAGGARVVRIASRDHADKAGEWYDQVEAEFVLVVAGAARLGFKSEKIERSLTPGDWVVIPARCKHRVAWTDPSLETIWLAVHLPAAAASAAAAPVILQAVPSLADKFKWAVTGGSVVMGIVVATAVVGALRRRFTSRSVKLASAASGVAAAVTGAVVSSAVTAVPAAVSAATR